MTSLSHPNRGTRRVEAWVYTVINPLIDDVRREIRFLQERNLTWRYHSQRLEYIRPVQEYIEPEMLPNLEDFLEENPAFVQKFEAHDKSVKDAESRAMAFYKIVMNAAIFHKNVTEALQKYESKAASTQPYAPSIESIKEHLPQFVAENLINNARELPAHYTIHSFWKNFGDEFREFILKFEGYKERKSFHDVEQAADALKEISSNLLNDLKSQRQTLCREFDIPAAPPATVRPVEGMFQS